MDADGSHVAGPFRSWGVAAQEQVPHQEPAGPGGPGDSVAWSTRSFLKAEASSTLEATP